MYHHDPLPGRGRTWENASPDEEILVGQLVRGSQMLRVNEPEYGGDKPLDWNDVDSPDPVGIRDAVVCLLALAEEIGYPVDDLLADAALGLRELIFAAQTASASRGHRR